MESISSLFESRESAKKFDGNSNRSYIISLFAEKMPDMAVKRIAVKVSHVKPDSELMSFYDQCLKARHFGKFFNWSLNPRNAKKLSTA